MTSPNPRVIAAIALLAAVAGCGGGGESPGADPAPSSGSPAAEPYNADQLTQALLTDVSGYERSGPPQWGPYGSLTAVQNSDRMRQAVKLDKPRCATATGSPADQKALQAAPAALTVFSRKGGRTLTETLMAVGPDVAAQEVALRVPAGCRKFRVRIGGHWASCTVSQPKGAHIGEGARSVGVTTVNRATTVRTWYVVLRSRGYLATVTLYGPDATQSDAERMARRAYQQAERILP